MSLTLRFRSRPADALSADARRLSLFDCVRRAVEGSRAPTFGGESYLTFFAWLGRQTVRQDAVGAFARYAVKDRIFPRQARKLNLFLARYEGMPEQRAGAKLAHREWRKVKRVV